MKTVYMTRLYMHVKNLFIAHGVVSDVFTVAQTASRS